MKKSMLLIQIQKLLLKGKSMVLIVLYLSKLCNFLKTLTYIIFVTIIFFILEQKGK